MDKLQAACDKLAAAMDVSDSDDGGAAPLALVAASPDVDASPAAEAAALSGVADAGRPLDVWFAAAAVRADARRSKEGDAARLERDLWAALARLSGEDLLEASEADFPNRGGFSTAWSAWAAASSEEAARREACALAWLEDGAADAARYFAEAPADLASLADGDCVRRRGGDLSRCLLDVRRVGAVS